MQKQQQTREQQAAAVVASIRRTSNPAAAGARRRALIGALADPEVALQAVELLAVEHERALQSLEQSSALIERFRQVCAGRPATVVGRAPEQGLLEVVVRGTSGRQLVRAARELVENTPLGSAIQISGDEARPAAVTPSLAGCTGAIGAVLREVGPDRVLVTHGEREIVLLRSQELEGLALEAGDELRIDPLAEMAHERLARPPRPHFLRTLPFPGTPVAALAPQALPPALERTLWELGQGLVDPRALQAHCVVPPRSLLLQGAPGCGKSESARLLAHWLAERHPAGQALLAQPVLGNLLSKYYGSTERQLDQLVESVRRLAAGGLPVVLFLDELDGLARGRGEAGNAVGDRVLTGLLAALDRLREIEGVLLVAATNRADLLDAAAIRQQRFDRLLQFERPGETAARAILDRHLPHAAMIPTEPERARFLDAVVTGLYHGRPLARLLLARGETLELRPHHLTSGALLAAGVREALSERAYRIIVAGGQPGPLGPRELVGALLRLVREAARQLTPDNAACRLPDLVGGHAVARIEPGDAPPAPSRN